MHCSCTSYSRTLGIEERSNSEGRHLVVLTLIMHMSKPPDWAADYNSVLITRGDLLSVVCGVRGLLGYIVVKSDHEGELLRGTVAEELTVLTIESNDREHGTLLVFYRFA